MRKKLIILVIIAGIIGTPIIAMSISPTRDLLLGMTSDEAVLALADKIDESRVDNEKKIQELQSTIDNQSEELSNYQKQIEEQNNKISETSLENNEIKENINNEIECQKLYIENNECNHQNYQTKSNFDKLMETYKKMDSINNEKTNIYERNYKEKKPIFDKCQEIIKQCN